MRIDNCSFLFINFNCYLFKTPLVINLQITFVPCCRMLTGNFEKTLLVIMKMETSSVNVVTLIIIASKHLFATGNKVQFECCSQINIENKGQEFDGLYKLDRKEEEWSEYCFGGCIYSKNMVEYCFREA